MQLGKKSWKRAWGGADRTEGESLDRISLKGNGKKRGSERNGPSVEGASRNPYASFGKRRKYPLRLGA